MLWDFGDGTQSQLPDPVHVYRETGLYSVTLKVSGPGGTEVVAREEAVLVQTPGARMSMQTVSVEPGAPGEVWHPVLASFAVPLRGFQIAVAFPWRSLAGDPVLDLASTPVARLRPEFVATRYETEGDRRAILAGIIFDSSAPFDGRVLEPPTGGVMPLLYLRYTVASAFEGSIPWTFTNTMGLPPIRNVFTSIETRTLFPLLIDGETRVLPGAEAWFLRGDANADGALDLGDAIAVLSFLFAQGEAPAPCLDAGDTNDSGQIDLADPISLLSFLFANGVPPAYPYPRAGLDPTPDGAPCAP
jgi:PKD repeat protein